MMDNSFCDFQEKRKCKIGPKVVQKGKSRQKKPLKPSKGQKDIRSLIKKNEIVSYSRDFNEICKQSGIDIDAEQLQLAIALSKSLDNFQSPAGSGSEDVEVQNKQCSSQERSARIRSTLQEYGFKVNHSKISLSLSTNKRRKYSKNSKLLQTSNEEKQIRISNKYAKVLARNSKPITDISECNYLKHEIFYKATNIPYEFIKDNDLFYITSLIEKAKHKSCLLRNWSEIPGRPISPEPIVNNIDFNTIQCSQDELDEILSSSIDVAQMIVRSKQNVCKNKDLEHKNKNKHSETMELTKCIESSNNNESKLENTPSPVKSCSYEKTEYNNIMEITNYPQHSNNQKNNDLQTTEVNKARDIQRNTFQDVDDITIANVDDNFSENNLQVYQNQHETKFRSASPDLFDDDCSILEKNDSKIENIIKNDDIIFLDLTESNKHINSNIKVPLTEIISDDIMEITECVTFNPDRNNDDVTKRKSCDIFNTTGCMTYKPDNQNNDDIIKGKYTDIIDITGSGNSNSEHRNYVDYMSPDKVLDKINSEENVNMVDLTQESNSNDELPKIHLGGRNTSLKLDTIIYGNNERTDFDKTLSLCDELSNTKKANEDLNKIDFDNDSNNICVFGGTGEDSQKSRDNIDDKDDSKKNDEINIDLAQTSEHSENNHSVNYPEYLDDNYEHFNHDSNDIENQNEIYDHCEHLNHDTLDNDVSLKRVNVPLDTDVENQNEIYDHCEHLNHDTLDNDVSLKRVNVPLDNDVENQNKIYDHCEHLNNDTLDNDVSLNSEKHTSINIDIEKQDKIKDNCGLEKLNHTSFTLDNHKDVSFEKEILTKSTSLDNDVEIGDVIDDHCDVEYLNSISHTLENDNDLTTSLKSAESLSLDNDRCNVDIDLTQGSEKSFEENVYNDNTNNIIEVLEDNTPNNDIITCVENDHCNIDLTQVNDEINVQNGTSRLGKVDKISIDYDDMFDEIAQRNNSDKISGKKSDVFQISGRELNYSIRHSIYEDVIYENDSDIPSQTSHPEDPKTPIKMNKDFEIQTPDNNDYIIKTSQVTPMADYDAMTTPERNKELEKYGLKPFKRKRAIQLLTYIYNQTHPIIQSCSPEEGPSKKFKRNNEKSPKKKSTNLKTPKKSLDFGSVDKENDIYIVTNELPDIRNVECDPRDWVFQNREKAKVHSCRVPLHIAFHNYVSCRRLLRESILKYEPINIDIISKELVAYGYKYNPKDLLKFMDKKCITVKTAENNLKNKSRKNHGN